MTIRDEFTAAYKERDVRVMDQKIKEANELFADLDRLLSTNTSYLLGKWLEDAKSFGDTPEKQAYYEKNARTLLTIWGGPILNDYANRLWAGLVSDYYAKRWNLFFTSVMNDVRNDKPFDEKSFEKKLDEFEAEWPNGNKVFPSEPVGNTLEIANEIYDKWEGRIENISQ